MERPTVRHRSRGVSLLELVSSLAILGFVVAATAGLYVAGQRSHFRARYYSDAQTTIRRALRDLTRTTRMAESVLAKGTTGTLNGQTTGASQLVLRLQSSPSVVECRYYVANGVLYKQTSADAAPGTPLLSGVVSLTFNYYTTLAGTRSSASANPAKASEVEIVLRARSGTVTTGLTAYVTIRQVVAGS